MKVNSSGFCFNDNVLSDRKSGSGFGSQTKFFSYLANETIYGALIWWLMAAMTLKVGLNKIEVNFGQDLVGF
jgi:hypothetical protein